MLTIDFPDKSITYDTFVHDVAVEVARQLSRQRNDPEMVKRAWPPNMAASISLGFFSQ